MKFTKDSINIDPVKETAEITSKLRENVTKKLKKRGAVVGISGGIDSSVVLALCAKTFGPDRVLGVMMPENDSNPDSLELAKKLSKYDGSGRRIWML
ncbi:MAG: hypothetical protein MUC75_02045 [Ignavibacteriaceae bacterium]|nr:hypothetical protein [Ignavibacteriaceae bacterium]